MNRASVPVPGAFLFHIAGAVGMRASLLSLEITPDGPPSDAFGKYRLVRTRSGAGTLPAGDALIYRCDASSPAAACTISGDGFSADWVEELTLLTVFQRGTFQWFVAEGSPVLFGEDQGIGLVTVEQSTPFSINTSCRWVEDCHV
jgi:hypothetical protein